MDRMNSKVPPSMESPEGMKTIYADKTDPLRVTYIPDIEYANRGRPLFIQMLTRAFPGSIERYPALVYVQGSAFMQQNVKASLPMLVDFAREGYVVASVEYRHTGESIFPAHIQDVRTAVRFLRANAERFCIDPARIAIWGDSSGGHSAALTGVSADVEEFDTDDFPGVSSGVSCVVDFYGPTDLAKMIDFPSAMDHNGPQSPEGRLVGGVVSEKPKMVRAASPITYITPGKDLPPYLVIHGDEDPLVPFNQSVILYEALRQNGHRAEFYKVLGGGHGMYLWIPEVLELVKKFLKAYL